MKGNENGDFFDFRNIHISFHKFHLKLKNSYLLISSIYILDEICEMKYECFENLNLLNEIYELKKLIIYNSFKLK